MQKNLFWISIFSLLLAMPAYAGDIRIEDATARATAPGQDVGSAGMVITSKKAARLVAVTSPASDSAEIHTMSMDNGVMKMRQLEFLPLPADQPVKLGPGGDHLMLIGLKKPLKAGTSVALTLTIKYADDSSEQVNVQAKVKPMPGMRHGNQQ